MVTVALAYLLAAKPQVTAWVVGYNPKSIERFAERADQIDAVFMEAYGVTADGLAFRRPDNISPFKKAREIAKKHKVQFFAMISNYAAGEGEDGFDPKRMTKALETEESRRAFATGLLKIAKEDKADGVDLDLESLKADDRNRYSKFVILLGNMLHDSKMKLSVTVHAKETVEGNWDGVKAHDYKALGSVADRFNVMTYDFSWSSGPEGPIAPTAWVERVMKFASTQMPASKLGMGIACYGYDWGTKPARSLSWNDLAVKPTKVDPESGELVDGKMHFSGAGAFRAKYDLASKLGLGSVAFWYCGSEDPGIWKFLPIRK